MSIFTTVWAWLEKKLTTVEKVWTPIAVTFTEELKTLWASGVPGFIAIALDKLFNSGTVIESAFTEIGNYLPAALATELGIENLPANYTPEQLATFEQNVISAWTKLTNKDKLYTTLQAQIGGIIQQSSQPGVKLTFGVLAADGEEIYQDYLTDVAAIANETPAEASKEAS